MKSTEKKSNKWVKHVMSIVLTGCVVFGAPIGVMTFTLFFDYTQYSYSTKIKVITVITLCLIAIPCYFICRYNFKSVWYVPLLANLGTLLIIWGIVSSYWDSNAKQELIIAALVSAIILSILGSIRGLRIKSKGIG